ARLDRPGGDAARAPPALPVPARVPRPIRGRRLPLLAEDAAHGGARAAPAARARVPLLPAHLARAPLLGADPDLRPARAALPRREHAAGTGGGRPLLPAAAAACGCGDRGGRGGGGV